MSSHIILLEFGQVLWSGNCPFYQGQNFFFSSIEIPCGVKESIPISTANASTYFASIRALERGKYNPAVRRVGFKDSLWLCTRSTDSDKSEPKWKNHGGQWRDLCCAEVWGGGCLMARLWISSPGRVSRLELTYAFFSLSLTHTHPVTICFPGPVSLANPVQLAQLLNAMAFGNLPEWRTQ